jgi:hypothetical protein
MAYQYRPPPPDRDYNRCTPEFVSPSPHGYPPNWRTQQSLLMGINTPTFHRQISISPQPSYMVSNFGSTQAPPNVTPPFSGRGMYPSSNYTYGNPGYYYDPMQFPVSHETQTSPFMNATYQDMYVLVHDTTPHLNIPTGDTSSQQANLTGNPILLPILCHVVMISYLLTFITLLKICQVMMLLPTLH